MISDTLKAHRLLVVSDTLKAHRLLVISNTLKAHRLLVISDTLKAHRLLVISNTLKQWRTKGGVWGIQTPAPPEIPKAFQNCAKLNPICENC